MTDEIKQASRYGISRRKALTDSAANIVTQFCACTGLLHLYSGHHVVTEVHRQCGACTVAGLQPSNASPFTVLQLCSYAPNICTFPSTAYSLSDTSAAAHGSKPKARLRMPLTSAW